MKKTILTLLIILFSISLFAQGFGYNKTYNEKQIKNFFSIDTVKTDDVYVINYILYIDRIMSDYPYHNYWSYNYNWHRYPFYNYWIFNSNWYYDDWYYYNYYWSCNDNWHYDNYRGYYSNYYHRYHNYYKPRPQRPIRQRTIATKTTRPVKSSVRPSDVRYKNRPARTTNTNRYTRPTSTYKGNVNRVRQSNYNGPARTYTRPTTRPTSTYNKPTRSTNRSYGTSTRSRSLGRGRR